MEEFVVVKVCGAGEGFGPGFAGAEAGGIEEDFEAERVAGVLELGGCGEVWRE